MNLLWILDVLNSGNSGLENNKHPFVNYITITVVIPETNTTLITAMSYEVLHGNEGNILLSIAAITLHGVRGPLMFYCQTQNT